VLSRVRTDARRVLLACLVVLITVAVTAGEPRPAAANPAANVAVNPAGAPVAAGPLVGVIVRYEPEVGSGAAERVVAALGGTVERRLDLIHAFAARVPAGAVATVGAVAGVLAVTPDAPVRLKGETWKADKDTNSLFSLEKAAGVHDVWAKIDPTGRKVTGEGIGVALIDSGVAPVKGLAGTGKVVNGPDLSFESQVANLRYRDTFGHGTHMAGIIAGRDPEVLAGKESSTSKYFVGVAPGAHVVNLKVAAADGATDVSQVIAAIDWVVAHRADPGLNIRVLNLSFGTDSLQDPRLDPLSYAVEVAWRKGIVVVVAVGNDGPTDTRLSMPAINPYVIAVGGSDPMATEARTDDKFASFSTAGDAARHADILAPGRSVVSLRDPGSFVDVNYPAALIPTDLEQRFFRGSGTSQAAAMVSGAAALLLQHRPNLTADQVKRLLMTTRQALPAGSGDTFGVGQIDVKKAAETAVPAYTQTHPAASGTGKLEGARGTAHVTDPDTGVDLVGERDIFGAPWNATTWSANAAAVKSWSGGTWNGNLWAGSAWTGTSWAARTWSAVAWTARTWSGALWTARTWSDASWTGTGWSGRTWSGRTWSGRTWSGGYWSGASWQ
jgi:serine protease AprX